MKSYFLRVKARNGGAVNGKQNASFYSYCFVTKRITVLRVHIQHEF